MNHYKGSGMGVVNSKQQHAEIKKIPETYKVLEIEGVIAGEHIDDINSLFSELYRFHD